MLSSSGLSSSDLLALNEIQKAADTAAAITRQLLQFSHKEPVEKQDVSLNDVICDAESLFRRRGGRFVTWQLDLDQSLGMVRADPEQLKQVLMSLVSNACHAIPDGGTVTVATANVDEWPSDPSANATGPFVALIVRDTGIGVSAQTARLLFEPFFTTKEPGRGAGLGLSIVHSIVTDLGGSIHLDSDSSKGASFTVYLPRAAATDSTVVNEPALCVA